MATLDCGHFFNGTIWVRPTEIHVWNGSSYVQAVEVHVYNGSSWIELFPCLVITQLAETALILDSGEAVKISRTVVKTALELLLTSETTGLTKKSISVAETANILDTAAATKISRDVVKGPYVELLLTSETGVRSLLVTKDTTSETALILDTGAVVKISRDVVKAALELLSTSETGTITFVKRKSSATETASILDTGAVVKVSRDIVKTSTELLSTSETGAISITTLPPVVDSCLAIEDEANVRARVRFNPGNFCRSVRIDKSVDGNHSFHQNMNTTPNTTNVFSNYYDGTCPEAVQFHIHPFTASNQGGLEGNDCNTTEVILGTPACK